MLMLPPLSPDSCVQAGPLSRFDLPAGWLRMAATTSGVRYFSQAVAPLAIQPPFGAAAVWPFAGALRLPDAGAFDSPFCEHPASAQSSAPAAMFVPMERKDMSHLSRGYRCRSMTDRLLDRRAWLRQLVDGMPRWNRLRVERALARRNRLRIQRLLVADEDDRMGIGFCFVLRAQVISNGRSRRCRARMVRGVRGIGRFRLSMMHRGRVHGCDRGAMRVVVRLVRMHRRHRRWGVHARLDRRRMMRLHRT